MPQKRNYDFEKRRKEQDRKAKKDAKRAERLERNRENPDFDPTDLNNPRPANTNDTPQD